MSGSGSQQPPISLPPPGDDAFTQEELKTYDGRNPSRPIYVSLKGTVFDVTKNRAIYGPECSYAVFAGKDISKAVGKSTIKEEEISADYSGLNEQQRKVLDDWYEMYKGKYPIVGKITDMPKAVSAAK